MIADISFHGMKQNHNPHAHIMLTLRHLKPNLAGFSKKAREWNNRNLTATLRTDWEQVNNQALNAKGTNKQISSAKNTPNLATPLKPHISRSVREMEKRGITTKQYELAYLRAFMAVLEHHIKTNPPKPETIAQRLLKLSRDGGKYLSNLQKAIIKKIQSRLPPNQNINNRPVISSSSRQ